FLSLLPLPPRSPLFPYTTLFRSSACRRLRAANGWLCPAPGRLCRFACRRLEEHRDELPDVLLAARIGRRTTELLDQTDGAPNGIDRKSTRLNSSHSQISYAVFCL